VMHTIRAYQATRKMPTMLATDRGRAFVPADTGQVRPTLPRLGRTTAVSTNNRDRRPGGRILDEKPCNFSRAQGRSRTVDTRIFRACSGMTQAPDFAWFIRGQPATRTRRYWTTPAAGPKAGATKGRPHLLYQGATRFQRPFRTEDGSDASSSTH